MTGYGIWGARAWVLLGVGALSVSMGTPVVKAGGPHPYRPLPPPPVSSRPYAADSLGRLTSARDLFRSTRRPASPAYDAQRAAAPVDVSQPPKPALVLVGLVAGGDRSG